jgi:alpha-mannosidase
VTSDVVNASPVNGDRHDLAAQADGVPSASRLVLHMIGNAHIDPVWLWQWPEGLQEVRATFASALDRMEEYPEFVFSCDSVAYLAWIEEIDPAMFERIKRRVAEGRWELVGGWWIEPDCNIPSGESFVRQGLYAQRFLASRFGLTATAGCNVDPFGHNANLPQILRKSGLTSYAFLRPEPAEKELPAQCFRWRSVDGSSVIAYRIPHGYCSPGTDLGEFIGGVLETVGPAEDELMVFYGVGNHGGGPTRANLDSIRQIGRDSATLAPRFATMGHYFAYQQSRLDVLPEYRGELQHHSVGCYSAHSGVKLWNRRAENLLLRAEKLATVATTVTGAPYPMEQLTEAWKLVLFNQFHDTLAGTAIAAAYEDSRDQYGQASSIAATAANRAIQSIGARVAIPREDGMIPVIVVNPLPWDVSGPVEIEFEGVSAAEVLAEDFDGRRVAVQRIQSQATVGGRHRRLVLNAQVPALGYRVYRMLPAAAEPVAPSARPRTVLDNGLIRAEIDPATGWLSSLISTEDGVELIPQRPGPHAAVMADLSDTWSHGVESYDAAVGQFTCQSVRLVEDGPVRTRIRIESTYRDSALTEDLILASGARHLEVRVVLDWHEKQCLLKLRFPSALASARVSCSVPYGYVERSATGTEEPGQAWIDVSGSVAGGATAGLSVVNDGKHGYDVRDVETGMTVARSPVYAWHDPRELDPGERYEYLDQGRQEFSYGLLPHAGDWQRAGTVRLAEEFNQPLAALPEHFHAGDLPPDQSFLDVGHGPVIVSVLKRAEDGDGVIAPARCRVDLRLLGRSVEAEFAPGEIKTFHAPDDPSQPVREVSLTEWPAENPGGAALDRPLTGRTAR